MEQEKLTTGNESSIFLQKNSKAIRIWHWLTFLFVIALITTVLLESTVLNQRKNIADVQRVLQEKGITATNNQALSVSHFYGEKMWDLHKIFGYFLTFLFLSRIIIEFTQKKEEKIKYRFDKALHASQQPGADRKEWNHYLAVKIGYSIFYFLLLVMVTTGMVIAFGADLGLAGPTRHTIKEVHGFFQYLIYAFIVLHLVGVIVADITKAKGIVSGMINGGK
jgi:cytochrome b561